MPWLLKNPFIPPMGLPFHAPHHSPTGQSLSLWSTSFLPRPPSLTHRVANHRDRVLQPRQLAKAHWLQPLPEALVLHCSSSSRSAGSSGSNVRALGMRCSAPLPEITRAPQRLWHSRGVGDTSGIEQQWAAVAAVVTRAQVGATAAAAAGAARRLPPIGQPQRPVTPRSTMPGIPPFQARCPSRHPSAAQAAPSAGCPEPPAHPSAARCRTPCRWQAQRPQILCRCPAA